jgi:hypothetical protein
MWHHLGYLALSVPNLFLHVWVYAYPKSPSNRRSSLVCRVGEAFLLGFVFDCDASLWLVWRFIGFGGAGCEGSLWIVVGEEFGG